MASTSPKQIQVFLSAPELGLPTRALTLDPDLPFHHLKLSLLQTLSLTLHPSSLHLSASGKPLLDSSTPSSASLTHLSHIHIRPRLPGGGGDGGATGAESRDCYLHMYSTKKPDKVDPNETRLCRWTTCAFSFEPLAPPCVIDRLGNIFNKEALLHAMLEKKLPAEFRHIRGLKDMVPVELSEIPGAAPGRETRFQCPITGLEFNGKYGFLALRRCGHVLSTKALKEVRSSGCLVCHQEFEERDKIVINGSKEEVAVLKERIQQEKEKGREKKERKEKGGGGELSGKKRGEDGKDGVLESCRRDGGTKRFKAVDVAPAHANKEVYASIFTSSKKGGIKETYSCRSLPLGRN